MRRPTLVSSWIGAHRTPSLAPGHAHQPDWPDADAPIGERKLDLRTPGKNFQMRETGTGKPVPVLAFGASGPSGWCYLRSCRTDCGTWLAWASMAVPACWRICARV